MTEKVINIEDLVQDDHNFNKGTEQGAKLIEKSFTDHGAGRSVLLDKDNRLISGRNLINSIRPGDNQMQYCADNLVI